jgi:hypothetical protein
MAEKQEGTTTRGDAKKAPARKSAAVKGDAKKAPARKSAAAKGTAKKSAARKSAAAKAIAKKAAAGKSAAPRAAAKNNGPERQISLEERFRWIQEAAYFKAEKAGFNCDQSECWLAAEAEIDARFASSR